MDLLKGVRGNYPRDYDQFFTKREVANECVKLMENCLVKNVADFDLVVEPSFGDGAFVDALQTDKLVFLDIDARDERHRGDFLACLDYLIPPDDYNHVYHSTKKRKSTEKKQCITVGNPPFGKNSSLAIEFFNKAAIFSSVIAFILPNTFCKSSIRDKLDRHFFLAAEYMIREDGFLFKNETYNVPCVFQIWINSLHVDLSKCVINVPIDGLRPLQPRLNRTPDYVFVDADASPDFAIRRVGVNAGRLFLHNPEECSKQSHFFISVNDKTRLPLIIHKMQSLDLEHTDVKFQTAGCPSISKSELCHLYMNAL